MSQVYLKEEWRPVIGRKDIYRKYYEVSNLGQVRSVDRLIVCDGPGGRKRQWIQRGKVLKMKLSNTDKRYAVALCRNSVCISHEVHILVATAFLGPRPDGMVCCHNDGNARNNCILNLRWDTQSSNIKDAVRSGTFNPCRGELNGNCILTDKEVEEIRSRYVRYNHNLSNARVLAKEYGVSKNYIISLVRGDWRRV